MQSRLSAIIKNPAIVYVASRYATYIVQFVNSLLIAVYLGPYYLGIWGFINLVLGYISQLNFGVSYSVNISISVHKQDEKYVQNIVNNGFTMLIILSALIVLFFAANNIVGADIGNKYELGKYIIPICIVAVFTHLNGLLSNIHRVFGKIYTIAFSQSVYPLVALCLLPFFKEQSLLWALVWASCATTLFSFALFLYRMPIRIKPAFNWNIVKLIQQKGWFLFVYATSFYLIMLVTRSFVSQNYTVSEFGYFTFAFTLANAVLLLLDSVSYLIFPKLLNRFANADKTYVQNTFSLIRSVYVSLAHLLIHLVVAFIPLLLLLFPAYEQSATAVRLIALTIVLYTNSFGHEALLLSRGKEKQISFIALGGLAANFLFCYLLIILGKISFDYAIVATLLTYFFYVFALCFYARKITDKEMKIFGVFKQIFPFRIMFPFVISLVLTWFSVNSFYFAIPLILFILLNIKDIFKIKATTIQLIKNPNAVNI